MTSINILSNPTCHTEPRFDRIRPRTIRSPMIGTKHAHYESPASGTGLQIQVVINWFQELKERRMKRDSHAAR